MHFGPLRPSGSRAPRRTSPQDGPRAPRAMAALRDGGVGNGHHRSLIGSVATLARMPAFPQVSAYSIDGDSVAARGVVYRARDTPRPGRRDQGAYAGRQEPVQPRTRVRGGSTDEKEDVIASTALLGHWSSPDSCLDPSRASRRQCQRSRTRRPPDRSPPSSSPAGGQVDPPGQHQDQHSRLPLVSESGGDLGLNTGSESDYGSPGLTGTYADRWRVDAQGDRDRRRRKVHGEVLTCWRSRRLTGLQSVDTSAYTANFRVDHGQAAQRRSPRHLRLQPGIQVPAVGVRFAEEDNY
jgi:hypothetical protein